MNKNRWPIILMATVVIVALSADKLVEFYFDLLWFEKYGFASVLWTTVGSQLGLGFVIGGLFFILSYGFLRSVYQKTEHLPVVLRDEIRREIPLLHLIASNLKTVILLAPLVLAAMTGAVAGQQWDTVLKFFNQVPFNLADPIFQKDYSFYLFTLPFLQVGKALLWELLVVAAIGAGVIYFFKQSIFLSPAGFGMLPEARRTFNNLAAAAFFMMAFEYFLKRYGLLTEGNGVVAGIGYSDDHGRLPLLNGSIVLAVACGIVALLNNFQQGFRKIVLAAAVLAAVHVGGNFYPSILQKFVVAPNELVKETEYIRHTITGTRVGYGLDTIENNALEGNDNLSAQSILDNSLTIENIRLWDQAPLLDTLGQIQEIRTYYQFNSVDNDRYFIDGNYRQTLLSPRELLSSSLPNRTWINEHLTFTHGYGVSLSPVNQITPEGLPVLFVKDIPPKSSVNIQVSQPEIYFGELSNDHVFVNTGTKEFDYPEGEKNVYKNYEGSGGILVDSFINKILLAARFKTLKILFSQDIENDSRVLMYRNITDRVSRIAPFLQLDRDPYLVISDAGRLVWIYDAYTVSDAFPYSQNLPGFGNYVRNSVKITVDAYEGTVLFYISDPKDLIIQSYRNIFPELFKDLKEMPEDLRKHIRYPSDLFAIQTFIHATYHMTSPQVFYNKEDQWEIPVIDGETMRPYYTIMKLPGKDHEEYILMLPFTPAGKSNLSAWMVARSDGEDYGKLELYTFPKQKLVYGPSQIVARINQNAEVSRQISLWDQRGSKVIQGNLLVIPIEESLIYVRPLYLKADAGKIPELKRVIVGYEDRVAMERTLEEALQKIFPGLATGTSSEATAEGAVASASQGMPEKGEVVLKRSDFNRIKDYYQRALESQAALDQTLKTNQDRLNELGELLDSAKPAKAEPVKKETTDEHR